MYGQGHRLEAGLGEELSAATQSLCSQKGVCTHVSLCLCHGKQGLGGETLGSSGLVCREVSLKTWLPHVAGSASTL